LHHSFCATLEARPILYHILHAIVIILETMHGSAPKSRTFAVRTRTGLLDQSTVTGRDPDSEVEILVADALRKRGFEVVPQVGVASQTPPAKPVA